MVLRPLDAGGMSGMTLRGSLRVSPIRPGRRASRGSGAGAGISGSPAGGRRTADQWDHFADNCVLPASPVVKSRIHGWTHGVKREERDAGEGAEGSVTGA